jgi:hypothetical protein
MRCPSDASVLFSQVNGEFRRTLSGGRARMIPHSTAFGKPLRPSGFARFA